MLRMNFTPLTTAWRSSPLYEGVTTTIPLARGHHASCSCKMGHEADPMAVVDSRFRVFGTKGLRIVDASVFPRIPGFFIVTPIYMISEKAADVIAEDAAPLTRA